MPIFEDWLAQADQLYQKTGRPLVSLCYAQSLDGCLTDKRGRQLAISGTETHRLTHQLRSQHDAILVGSGTVLADNPHLTVRLADGPNPQPVVLDSRLRTPANARLIFDHPRPAWIATTGRADAMRRAALESAGATILTLPENSNAQVDLAALLDCLGQRGIRRLMVEGGAAVISALLAADLADVVSITIAPLFLGGLSAVERALPKMPRLRAVEYQPFGQDLVVWGRLGDF